MQGDIVKGIPGTENIAWIKSEKKFIISKRINGRPKFLGSHKSLICALMIRDYCKAHNWSKYPKSKNKTGEHHIVQRNKDPFQKYTVYKIINGVHVTFGSYATLEEAITRRDECIKHNWDRDLLIPQDPFKYIDIVLNKDLTLKYTVRHKENNSTVNYGLFDNFTDAMYERDLLVANNWDSEVMCNLDERTNGEIIYLNRVMS